MRSERHGDGRVECTSLEGSDDLRPCNGLDLEAVLVRDCLRLQVDDHPPVATSLFPHEADLPRVFVDVEADDGSIVSNHVLEGARPMANTGSRTRP